MRYKRRTKQSKKNYGV